MKVFIILLLLFPTVTFAQTESTEMKNNSHQIEILPVSKYDMGRNVKLIYGKRIKEHYWYGGFGIHVGNASKEKFSNTSEITHNNGYAAQFSDYLHPTLGYRKYLMSFDAVSLYSYVDLIGGTIHLGNHFYGYGGVDSLGNSKWISQYSPEVSTKKGQYLQLTLGCALELKLSRRIALTNRIGFGESIVVYHYDVPANGITYNEGTIDHFVLDYGLGISMAF